MVRDEAVARLCTKLASAESSTAETQFVSDLVTAIESDGIAPVAQRVADFGRRAPRSIGSRSRSLLVLVDLVLFDPWPAKRKCNASARHEILRVLTLGFPDARESDLDAMFTEQKALIRQLRRKNVRWGRVAVAGALGLGIGVATAGWAAPLIGTAIGTAAGLSGAAATSAGLATSVAERSRRADSALPVVRRWSPRSAASWSRVQPRPVRAGLRWQPDRLWSGQCVWT